MPEHDGNVKPHEFLNEILRAADNGAALLGWTHPQVVRTKGTAGDAISAQAFVSIEDTSTSHGEQVFRVLVIPSTMDEMEADNERLANA